MAVKVKNVFFCSECGHESSKWLGQCPGCKAWNSFVEEPVQKKSPAAGYAGGAAPAGKRAAPQKLSEVTQTVTERVYTGIGELDRVLGGGIVTGSLVLVGGDPGIGKSTLLLQMCSILAGKGHHVLYISGEESPQQIKMRADRLSEASGNLLLLAETNLDLVEAVVLAERPELVVIDSIQTMYREDIQASPGSVSQVRETTGSLLRLAKGEGISIFIVGHVTKEGVVAGPRVLVEVQALVCQTNFNMPRRTAAGMDLNRVNLLLAVLEKRLGIQLAYCDAYINVAGGMRISEPALDLAVVFAILSSYKNRAVPERTLVFGEVGLTGEIRAVTMAPQRVAEAQKLGYVQCILPHANLESIRKNQKESGGIGLIGVKNVRDLFGVLER